MDELLQRIRELAEGLAYAHFAGPPVDPFVLAERLGIEVERSGTAPRWVRRERRVYLLAEMAPERARFTLAHEIIELCAAEASPPFPLVRELAGRAEQLFQLGASELLMPRAWFEASRVESEGDLAHLRRRFEVSWEAVARRIPLLVPAVCTIVDNGVPSGRVASEGLRFPRDLAPEEREAVAAAYDAWPDPTPQRRSGPGFRCEAWPALPERNRIRRVCVMAYVEEDG